MTVVANDISAVSDTFSAAAAAFRSSSGRRALRRGRER
jgi:hypothetical protein